MIKIILGILLSLPLMSFAQNELAFEIRLESGQGRVLFHDNGKVEIQSNDFSAAFNQSLATSLSGLRVHRDSIKEAQNRIVQRLVVNTNLRPQVQYSPYSSFNNPFIKKQVTANLKFESDLAANIYNPTFKSEILDSDISFDVNDPKEKDALKIYRESQNLRYAQLGANENYNSAIFSKNVIELRQFNRLYAPTEDLDALSNLAQGVLNNNSSLTIEAMKWLLRSNEFQRGFSAAIANHFNPVSFLYSIDSKCSNQWCRTGQLLGDTTSALIGAYEFMSGAMMALGGGGMTLALAGAAPGTGGLSTLALPSTAGAALAGISMAGHGLSTLGSAFDSLFSEIDNPQNTALLEESRKVIEETGIDVAKKGELAKNSSYETVKEFYRSLKDTNIESSEKKSLIRSFELKDLKMEILQEDKIVYRWHNNDADARMLGRFVSPDKIANSSQARSLLALPEKNRMLYLDEYKIKKGTQIFSGRVAPLNGHNGGGTQYFIIGDLENIIIR